METLLALLPLALVIGVVVAVVKWRRGRSPQPTPPAALAPLPTYHGPFAFFRRHYNGDYRLGRSYWVNTFLILMFAPVLGLPVIAFVGENFPARYASAAVLFFIALIYATWFWAVKGTWASATKHVSRGGKPGWASVTKLVIVLSVIRTAVEVTSLLPSLQEHLKVASGWQVGPETRIEILPDGKSVRLTGGINDGAAKQLAAALKVAPSVRTLVLNSQGGWMREGGRIADLVRQHELATYVESGGTCSSACTIAFLAGRDRAADPSARIGFHAVRFVGSGSTVSSTDEEAAVTRRAYDAARLPPEFVRRIAATPPNTMWYPDHAELVKAGVLTRPSSGGETPAMAGLVKSKAALDAALRKVPAYAALARQFPDRYQQMLDGGWQAVEQGRSDAAVIAAQRAVLVPLVMELLPWSSDETLEAYIVLLVEQMKVLLHKDPLLCYQFVYGEGDMAPIAHLPQEMLARELDLVRRVIEEADRTRPALSEDEAEAHLRTLRKRFAPAELDAISSDESRRRDPAAACRGVIFLYTEVLALRSPARMPLLRYLLV